VLVADGGDGLALDQVQAQQFDLIRGAEMAAGGLGVVGGVRCVFHGLGCFAPDCSLADQAVLDIPTKAAQNADLFLGRVAFAFHGLDSFLRAPD
jgi:hypothetical protein